MRGYRCCMQHFNLCCLWCTIYYMNDDHVWRFAWYRNNFVAAHFAKNQYIHYAGTCIIVVNNLWCIWRIEVFESSKILCCRHSVWGIYVHNIHYTLRCKITWSFYLLYEATLENVHNHEMSLKCYRGKPISNTFAGTWHPIPTLIRGIRWSLDGTGGSFTCLAKAVGVKIACK